MPKRDVASRGLPPGEMLQSSAARWRPLRSARASARRLLRSPAPPLPNPAPPADGAAPDRPPLLRLLPAADTTPPLGCAKPPSLLGTSGASDLEENRERAGD